jgi:Holliday junction resolvasome RuvABC ATP-dependent DNA helicase subunit
VSLLIVPEKKLKVVSIVGFGGLGKTSLANQVYDEIGEQFDRKAFLLISQKPDMKSLLIGLQRKLMIEEESSYAHELQEIIDRLKEYLKLTRYIFLVVTRILPWSRSKYLCGFIELS